MTRRRTLVVAGLAAVTILSTILRLLVPLWVIGDAVEDDQLFVRLGSSLRDGAWLGPFDTRTLQKGPAFPAFLALAQQTRLPYLLVVHLVHLLACAAAAGAIGRAAGSRQIGCWLYVVLALDPSYYGWGASRVLRDNWYSSVCLLLFALAALALPGSGSGGPAVASRWARRALAGVAAGLVLAGYWLTRAEHPWLLPAIAAVLAAAVVFRQHRQHRLRPAGRWRGWLVAAGPVVGCAAVAVAVLAATTWGVAAQNRRAYGASLTDDFAGGQFARLYSTWQSVHAGPARRYVPISRPQRLAVYRVSGAAAGLEPALEGAQQGFVVGSCRRHRVCDDITAGLIPYAIRNATASAGEARTEEQAQRYWGLVADQIAAACSDGRLSCGRPMPTMLPSPSRISVGAFVASASVELSVDGDLPAGGHRPGAEHRLGQQLGAVPPDRQRAAGHAARAPEPGARRSRPGEVPRGAAAGVPGRAAGAAAAGTRRVRPGTVAPTRAVGRGLGARRGGGPRGARPGPAARPDRLDVVPDRAGVQLRPARDELPAGLHRARRRPAAALPAGRALIGPPGPAGHPVAAAGRAHCCRRRAAILRRSRHVDTFRRSRRGTERASATALETLR